MLGRILFLEYLADEWPVLVGLPGAHGYQADYTVTCLSFN